MKLLFTAVVLTLITLPVLAVPAGYEMDSLNLGHTCSSVFLVDVDVLVYYGHPSPVAMNRKSADRGSRAPADEIWVVDPSSGSATLLYSALNHSGDTHQIKSASGSPSREKSEVAASFPVSTAAATAAPSMWPI